MAKNKKPEQSEHTMMELNRYSTGARLLFCRCGRLECVQYEPEKISILLEPGDSKSVHVQEKIANGK
jgi:hypothetical protein